MGLLDNVLGAATQALGQQQGGGHGGVDDHRVQTGAVGEHGGLAGVLLQPVAGGLAEHVHTLADHGGNLPVTGAQLSSALGGAGGLLAQLAQQAGVSHAEAGEQLSQRLGEDAGIRLLGPLPPYSFV